jgi:hypothetical protein
VEYWAEGVEACRPPVEPCLSSMGRSLLLPCENRQLNRSEQSAKGAAALCKYKLGDKKEDLL